MEHQLKTWTQFYKEIAAGRKNFEVRKNDRNFKHGDVLILKEWLPTSQKYTGEIMRVKVDYILYGGQFGIEQGFCVMSISKI